MISFLLVLPVSIISLLLPLPIIARVANYIVAKIYRNAVRMDSFWMQDVVGIRLIVKGARNKDKTPVVICNHQSWFDIPLVQEVITGKGPIVRFLIKQEIVWIPIIG
ncbi:MAG: 1-acyl-sn-glycerol-3-phosphate acyltransferase, partial [Arenicella sp.]